MTLRNYDGIVSIHLDNDLDNFNVCVCVFFFFLTGGGGERVHNFPKRVKNPMLALHSLPFWTRLSSSAEAGKDRARFMRLCRGPEEKQAESPKRKVPC